MSAIADAADAGFDAVLGMSSSATSERCDAAYLGSLVGEDTTCPRCKASVVSVTIVEYPETCALCDGEPAVFWQTDNGTFVGLCNACGNSDEGKEWVANLDSGPIQGDNTPQ